MLLKKRNYKHIYIFYLLLFVLITIFSTTNVLGKIYKIEDINVNEPYTLSFQKKKVIEKAFLVAFAELLKKITISKDTKLLKNVEIKKVKELVDSFIIVDEKFIDNKYFAKFEVDFNKNKILKFLDKKNTSSSVPLQKKIFILPILVDLEKNQILLFSENIFYNEWKKNKKNYFLIDYILPNEDLEDINIMQNKIKEIENYEFEEIIKKYNINDYIILLVFKDRTNVKVLSKIYINNKKKITTNLYNQINLKNINEVSETILDLKTNYEDEWKKQNVINQSIKLPIKISLNSKAITLINKFENKLIVSDFVYEFNIENFTNNKSIYKIIYNNTPDKFLKEFRSYDFNINSDDNVWILK